MAQLACTTEYYGVKLFETNWHELGKHLNLHRFEAAAKAARTRKRHSNARGLVG
jgi:hypothetical protein